MNRASERRSKSTNKGASAAPASEGSLPRRLSVQHGKGSLHCGSPWCRGKPHQIRNPGTDRVLSYVRKAEKGACGANIEYHRMPPRAYSRICKSWSKEVEPLTCAGDQLALPAGAVRVFPALHRFRQGHGALFGRTSKRMWLRPQRRRIPLRI